MSQTISITIQNQKFGAELNDSPATEQLLDALPLKLRMSRWGDEYYCFFFGPTPASTDERPRAASAVAPLGRFTTTVDALESFGSSIDVEIVL
jgi:hypothetical protein